MPLPMTPTQLTVLTSVSAFDSRISPIRIFMRSPKRICHRGFARVNLCLVLGILSAQLDSRHTPLQASSHPLDPVLATPRTLPTCVAFRRWGRLDVTTTERTPDPP